MTTQAMTVGGTGTRPRPSLEELVDRLLAVLFRDEPEPEAAVPAATPSVARSVHEARRLRQAGDMWTGRWRSSQKWTRRRLSRTRRGGPTPSGRTW